MKDELFHEIQYITTILLDQFFYPVYLSTTTANVINNKEKYAIGRFNTDPLFRARVKKLTNLIVDKTFSIITPELKKAEKWNSVKRIANIPVDDNARKTYNNYDLIDACYMVVQNLEGGKKDD